MNKKTFSGAYSRRRFSNFTTSAADNAGYRIVTKANDRSMGDVHLTVVNLGGSQGQNQYRDQEIYGKLTPDSGQLYAAGTQLRITAEPKPGYKFVSWSGVTGANHTARSFVFTVDRDMIFTAMFEQLPDTFRTVNVGWNANMGKVTMNGNGLQNGNVTVHSGDSITLTATPFEGYHFVRWSGFPIDGSTSQQVSFNVNNNYILTAVFGSEGGGGGSDDTPQGGGGGSDDPQNQLVAPSLVDKAIPFVKKYWWAIAIAAWLYLDGRKGGSK